MRSKCLILFLAILLPAQESSDLLDAPGWLSRGVEAYKAGRLQPAAEAFQRAIEMNPGDIAGHLYLASTWMAQFVPGANTPQSIEFARRAENEFLQVVGIDPENKTAILALASLSFQQAEGMPDSTDRNRKLDAARAWYESVIRLDPSLKEAYLSLGLIAWSNWHPKWMNARIQCGLKSADAGPMPDAAARAQLKDQYGSTIETGIFNLERAVELDPNYEEALRYLQLLVRSRADLRDTKEEYQRDIQTADEWLRKQRENEKSSTAALTAAVLSSDGASGGGLLDPAHQLVPIKGVVLVRRVDPIYPAAALDAGVEGTVRFRAFIGKDGHVRSLQLISGHPLLASAARDAVQQWEYSPTLLSGAPVDVVTDISINFTPPR